MSFDSYIKIDGEGAYVYAQQGYIPMIAALFSENEKVDDLEGDERSYGYRSVAGEVRQRLILRGFTRGRVLEDLRRAVASWHECVESENSEDQAVFNPEDLFENGQKVFLTDSDILDRISLSVNVSPSKIFDDPAYDSLYPPIPDAVEQYLDPRSVLALLIDQLENTQASIFYELRDMISGLYFRPGANIAERARAEGSRAVAAEVPLIVLTEGRSDSELLSKGMQITHPHLVGFLQFLNYQGNGDLQVEGGVGRFTRIVTNFVTAGVANRIVVLVDNDSAAQDALKSLKKLKLPDRFRVVHYPSLELLRAYPVLRAGAVNTELLDVNGFGGFLEMYLGEELLTVNGVLVPLREIGFVGNPPVNQFDFAESRHKKRIAKEFRTKVKEKRDGDWSGVASIIDAIVFAFD